MNCDGGPAFSAVRLNYFTDESWAVVKTSSGAIALDAEGGLMMRMTKLRASDIAARLSEQCVRDGRCVPPPADMV